MAASTRGRVSHSARHPGEQPVGAGPSPGPKAMPGRGAICADGSAVMQRRGQKRMRPQSVRSSAAYRSQMRDVPDERAATWEPVIPRAAHKKTWRGFYASPAGSGANGRKLHPAPGSAFLCPVVAGAGSCAPSTSDIVRMNGRCPPAGTSGRQRPCKCKRGLQQRWSRSHSGNAAGLALPASSWSAGRAIPPPPGSLPKRRRVKKQSRIGRLPPATVLERPCAGNGTSPASALIQICAASESSG